MKEDKMREELAKNYSPKDIEGKWYEYWETNKYFAATMEDDKPNYSIVMPPPNVTGILHIGHVLNNTIQDCVIRYKRMSGFNTLWMPGTDHAGIATQNMVERKLATEGLKKEDLGREKFVERVWDWKGQYGGIITNQLRKLGASLDWDRERFTMDEGLSAAVREIFVKLYNDGLIYRGEYMINWCPRCGTALADDEVEHEEKEGKLYFVKYPIKDSDEFLTISTTRPETMLADVAVAVNPNDERFNHLIGKTLILPLVGREIPVIGDEYVDVEFGTGALKITPAHDPNDFAIGEKHKLPVINMMTKEGFVVDEYAKYAGLERFEARKIIVEDLEREGFLVQVKAHGHQVGGCYRCSTVVEPRVSMQWFVNMKPLAEKAIAAVKEGDVNITPKRWEGVYFSWLDNIRDWCISRQIWWGHRIPAWYGPDRQVFVAKDEKEAAALALAHYGREVKLEQEDDVLDTWFSSALWPFSTFGWPDKTAELEKFYPTATLVTGADIIFFWVARMIMFGIYEMKEVPFKDVYLHGIVRDELGRKMSKTLGNSPDPLTIIDEFGADSLRFTMLFNTSQGQDVHYSEKLLEMGRNFANKIWNVSRFVGMNLEGFDVKSVDPTKLQLELVDQWIISRFNQTAKVVGEKIDKFILDEAAKAVYEFLRGDLCDWYVELAKVRLYNSEEVSAESRATAQYVLHTMLEGGLRLLHPFMPFITEEIWQKMDVEGETIMLQEFPLCDDSKVDLEAESAFTYVQGLISSLRNIKAEVGISPAKEVKVVIRTKDTKELATIENNMKFINKLCKIEELTFGAEVATPEQSGFRVNGKSEVFMILTGLLNVEAETKKLNEQIAKVLKEMEPVNRKLSDEKFTSKAPAHILDRERRIQQEYQDKLEKLQENLKNLG